MRNTLRLIAMVLLLGSAAIAATPEVVDDFAAGNKFYEEKDFISAIRVYNSIISQGVESAPLYFNLGNAYFKSGDLGHAVLYYLKAKRLDPGNEDIRHNLEFAKQFSRVQMEGVELNPVKEFFVTIVDPYHLHALAWVSSALFVALMIILILRFGLAIRAVVLRLATVALVVLLLVGAGLTSFKYRIDYLDRRGVIIAEDTPVRTGASDQSDIELQGAPGLIVEIVDESGDYYNVLFENKRRGWVKKDLVADI